MLKQRTIQGLFKPQAPKLKNGQTQPNVLNQAPLDKQDGDGDGHPTATIEALQENNPPPAKAEPTDLTEEPEATKAPGVAKSRGAAAAASEAADAKGAAAERPRQRARVPPEPKAGQAAKKPEGQRVQPAASGGALRGGSNRPSLGAPQPRTGEEIWQLNMQLGRMAEQLADPDDAKPGRRKAKSPNLAENLQKRWGGTYGEMLDKNFDAIDVEEPAAPKYEPPLFLEDVSVAGNEDDGDEPVPRPVERAGKNHAAQPSAAGGAPAGPMSSPASAGAAAPAPARVQRGAATVAANGTSSCLAAAPAGASKKAEAAPATAAATVAVAGAEPRAKKGRKDADAGRDTASEADTPDGQQQADQDPQPSRRGGRRAKAAAAEPATTTKAAPQRAAARRTGRGTAAAADVAVEDQGEGDPMDAALQAAAAATAPSVPNHTTTRIRRSHMPSSTAFGSTISKPPADCVEDAAVAGGGEAAAGATAAKRARDGGVTVDEKLRLNKASRIEQQYENLRRQHADLELKCKGQADQIKQQQGELAAAEKRAAIVDGERKREANELAAAHKEIEKLKAKLKERDDKIANLEDDLKQAKAREIKMQRQAEQWQAECLTQAQQQYEKMIKGWRS